MTAPRNVNRAVTDDGSLARVTDDASPQHTESGAASGTTHGGCVRDDIGDDCRCDECEARRIANMERAWEVAQERGL